MNKKTIIILAAALLLLISGFLVFSFLQKDKTGTGDEELVYGDVLNIYNWDDYLGEEVIRGFEEMYGIKVNLETYEDSDDVLIALQGSPEKYDIVVAEDDDVEYFSQLRYLENLNHAKIPNISNIKRGNLKGSFNENMLYCAPYVPGYTGVAINPKYVNNYDGDRSVFWNEAYRGKITMPMSSQEILLNSIYYLGYDPNKMTQEQFKEAEAKSLELKNMDILFGDPVQQREWLAGEGAWIGYTYSTEVVFIQEENEDIEFFAPKEGVRLWADSLCIPKHAKNKEGAYLFINYLLDIENMAKNSEEIYAMMPGINIERYIDADILEKIKGLDFPEDKNILAKSRYSYFYLTEEVQEIFSNISRELNIRE